MKFGYRTASFGSASTSDTFRHIASAGYTGVELCLEHPELEPVGFNEALALRIKSELKVYGLQIATVSYHGDGVEIGRRLLSTVRAVRATSLLGAPTLVINTEKKSSKDDLRRIVNRLKILCELGEEYNIYIAVEPEPDLIVSDTEDMLALLEEVNSPRLKVNLDVGHSYCSGENVVESLRRLLPHIVQFHIEDIKGRVHKHLLPGEGDIPLRDIIRSAVSAGYAGFFTIDLFAVPGEPADVARRALTSLLSLLSLTS